MSSTISMPRNLRRSYGVDKLLCDFFLLRCPDAYEEAIMYRRIIGYPMPLNATQFLIHIFNEGSASYFRYVWEELKNKVNLELFLEGINNTE